VKKLFEILGGRKLVLGFIVITIGVLMDVLAPSGLSSNLLYLLCFISTSFFLANAAVTASYSKNQERVNDVPAMDETSARLDQVQSQLEQVIQGTATISQALAQIIKRSSPNK
jgi:hypothetical protein